MLPSRRAWGLAAFREILVEVIAEMMAPDQMAAQIAVGK